MRSKLLLGHALLAIGAGLAPVEHGMPMRSERERDQRPRKFTDARIAAAEAKRKAKAAKRAKAVRLADDQQIARELLAQEYESDGITHVPDCIRREAMLTEMEHRAIRAITAALRAAPAGFVVCPEDPSASMIRAGLLFGLTPNQACTIYQSMLAARPQGVK